jgi:hypothetical protein
MPPNFYSAKKSKRLTHYSAKSKNLIKIKNVNTISGHVLSASVKESAQSHGKRLKKKERKKG